jgi:hypothetical protein
MRRGISITQKVVVEACMPASPPCQQQLMYIHAVAALVALHMNRWHVCMSKRTKVVGDEVGNSHDLSIVLIGDTLRMSAKMGNTEQ